MSVYDTINTLKKNIDLLNYLANEGFTIGHKSTKKGIVLENKATGEKLLVYDKDKNNNSFGHWIYANVLIDSDKGDIHTFVRNRINGFVSVDYSSEATSKAIKILNPFLSIAPQENLTLQKSVRKQKLKKEISKSEYNTKPIADFNFLYQRAIHPSTINHKDFKNKILNSFYFNKNNHQISNTAFAKSLHWNTSLDKDIVGYEVRNHDVRKVRNDKDISQVFIPFKSVALDDAALFFSNIPKPNEKITHLFFAESAIDILAYHELLVANKKGYDMEKNNHLFISFGGNIYDKKIENLKAALDKLLIDTTKTQFISITDNDKKGYYYDLTLVTTLINHYKSPIELKIKDATFYSLKFDNQNINISDFNEQIKVQNQTIQDNMQPEEAANLYGKFIIFKKESEGEGGAAKTQNKSELLIPMQEDTIENNIKFLSKLFNVPNFYIAHKPEEKGIDWNDKLFIKKKIKTVAFILNERKHIKRIQKEITQRRTDKLNDSQKKKSKLKR
jgi:hypothetical protein